METILTLTQLWNSFFSSFAGACYIFAKYAKNAMEKDEYPVDIDVRGFENYKPVSHLETFCEDPEGKNRFGAEVIKEKRSTIPPNALFLF